MRHGETFVLTIIGAAMSAVNFSVLPTRDTARWPVQKQSTVDVAMEGLRNEFLLHATNDVDFAD